MIGIAVPVHNEEARLADCLRALAAALRNPALDGEACAIVIVLDACSDGSADICRRFACQFAPAASHSASSANGGAQPPAPRASFTALAIDARNVGRARAAGADHLLALGARWLAFTDGDSMPAADWLPAQLALGADAVCGCVTVGDWQPDDHALRRHYDARYHHADGHRHVHGANLGVAAAAYRAVGGFLPRATGEDVDLVARLQAGGYDVAWSARPRVVTTARLEGRAPDGFAALIGRLRDECRPAPQLGDAG